MGKTGKPLVFRTRLTANPLLNLSPSKVHTRFTKLNWMTKQETLYPKTKLLQKLSIHQFSSSPLKWSWRETEIGEPCAWIPKASPLVIETGLLVWTPRYTGSVNGTAVAGQHSAPGTQVPYRWGIHGSCSPLLIVCNSGRAWLAIHSYPSDNPWNRERYPMYGMSGTNTS